MFLRVLAATLTLLLATLCVHAADTDAETLFQNRKRAMKRMAAPVQLSNGPTKFKGYDLLAQTAQLGCGPAAWPEYMSQLASLPVSHPDDGPVEMFAVPPLVRYLYQFGHCMSSAQKNVLLESLTSKKQWLLGHGTINHAIMKASSWYLLAQYFPDAKWTHWDGKVYTSPQLMAELKRLMTGRTAHFFKAGQLELLSPTYAMVNLFPLLNLVDFADDSAVKALADKEAILQVAALQVSSFRGVIVPPVTRKNYDQRNALETSQDYAPSIAQQVLWFYFGEPSGLGLYDFQGRSEPYYFVMLALSNWRPPTVLNEIHDTANLPYELHVKTPEFGIWDAPTSTEIYGDSFVAEDFAVGTGNLLFDPFGYSGHIQLFSVLLNTTKALNQIECSHPYWNSNDGEDAWGTDRSSPFQQMYRYDQSSVTMVFNIPQADPWQQAGNSWFAKRDRQKNSLFQVAQCRIPKGLDVILTEPNWVFVREGSSFAAIGTLKGTNSYGTSNAKMGQKYVVLKAREPKTALFVRVDSARPDFNFDQFKESVKKSAPDFDAATSRLSIKESDGAATTVEFKLAQTGKRWAALPVITRNGKVLAWDTPGVITTKAVQLKDGVLTLTGSNGAVVLNAK